MGLFGTKRTTVGLDIGTGFVKLAEVGHGGDRPELRRLEMRPMPAGAIVDGEVREPGLVVDCVRELVEEAGVAAREVVTALGGHDVFIKRLQVPRVDAAEAGPVVRREAERHVPFDIGDMQFDFQILAPQDDGAQMEVLFVAARRRRVEERITLLAEAGVGAVLVDVEAFALCNAFAHNYPASGEDLVALVDCGHDATAINVFHHGAPILVRDHHFGLRGLAESLARDREVSLDRATEAVRSRRPLAGLDEALDEAAGVVAAEVERAAAFLRARRPGMGLGRVFVCGGGACMPALVQSLGRRMKTETRAANPFEMVAVRSGAPGRVELSETAPLFLLTLGLALRTA